MELIAALLHAPRVLFLDEPTIGLDVVSQKKVREFLRRYNSEHRIVTMLTSHYMQDIEELCERVIIIDHGRIFFDGPLSAIIDRFATHKILSLVFAGPRRPRFTEFGEVLSKAPETVQLKVPRAKVTETCRAHARGLPRHRHQRAGNARRRSDPPAFWRACGGDQGGGSGWRRNLAESRQLFLLERFRVVFTIGSDAGFRDSSVAGLHKP